MNILCKIFWHRMHFADCITGPTYCKRWKCDHKGPGITWPRLSPMPECKPPKKEESKMEGYTQDDISKQIENNFIYHSPKKGQPERYEELRSKAMELAKLINFHCPPSREKSVALTKLEESVMWANAGIARN